MSRRNWINLFSNSQAIELSSDLERGYEAALLIQSLELEYYGDRQIRPELKLSVPRSVRCAVACIACSGALPTCYRTRMCSTNAYAGLPCRRYLGNVVERGAGCCPGQQSSSRGYRRGV